MRRESATWPWWAEMILVVVVSMVSVPEANAAIGDSSTALPSIVACLVAGGLLPLRHRWPLPVTAGAVAAAGGWGAMLPLMLVTFHLSALGRVRIAAGAAALALGVNSLVQPALSLWASRTYGPCALLTVALALGLWAGSSRRLADALAAQMTLRENAARSSERTAIAAEMHDVLAHRLSLIALHSGVLAARTDQHPLPPAVADRVRLLRTASIDALNDLRDVLGALRTTDRLDAADALAPAVREVDELIDAAREAGQTIEAAVEGDENQAPAAHRLAVYRLVREAVTNARKHAPDAPVRVHVRYGARATHAEVTNTAPAGSAPAAVPPGFGLIGLRERIQALGGKLDAGPSGRGTWRVAARIPTKDGGCHG